MMNVVFVRSFLPHVDSRMQKAVRALKNAGHGVRFIGWSRGHHDVPSDQTQAIDLYPARAGLGRRWGNLFALLGWNLYVLRVLWRRRRQVDVVHAVDLDSALAAWVFCRMAGKPLVFDVYDHYADTRGMRGVVASVFSGLERFVARHADLTLLADDCRYEQHGLRPASHILVIENVPDSTAVAPAVALDDAGPLRIGYFGVFEPQHRGLENLLQAFAGQAGVVLHFGGYGPLTATIVQAEAEHDNVVHHGPLDHEEGMTLMATMHCMVGFYYLSVPNHRYAAPNKYYEHLFLGRALLTTIGTPPGCRVRRDETGWALGESVQALRDWHADLTQVELIRRGHNAQKVWLDRYQCYIRDTYADYVQRLQVLAARGGQR